MPLSDFFILPFGVQAFAILVDEFVFHRSRNLPRWERLGHPIDTFSVVLCYLFIFALAPSLQNIYIYSGLCLISCILVTKDEFIHRKVCGGAESWLHAVLFLAHPVTFIVAGIIWQDHATRVQANDFLWMVLQLQLLAMAGFLFYQILYWNYLCKTKPT